MLSAAIHVDKPRKAVSCIIRMRLSWAQVVNGMLLHGATKCKMSGRDGASGLVVHSATC